jgi:death-on-curing protein
MGAAYAFHIAEAQAYLDGNKRTAVAAALTFLEANGVATDGAEPMALYPDMIAIAAGELDRPGLARRIRELFG